MWKIRYGIRIKSNFANDFAFLSNARSSCVPSCRCLLLKWRQIKMRWKMNLGNKESFIMNGERETTLNWNNGVKNFAFNAWKLCNFQIKLISHISCGLYSTYFSLTEVFFPLLQLQFKENSKFVKKRTLVFLGILALYISKSVKKLQLI